MNPLEENPTARKRAYQAFWIISLIVGATQVGFATAEAPTPTWLKVVLGVLPFVGAAIGYTAQVNVSEKVPPAGGGGVQPFKANELGVFETSWVVALAAIIIVICGLVWLIQNLS